jgi:hypothetical protein
MESARSRLNFSQSKSIQEVKQEIQESKSQKMQIREIENLNQLRINELSKQK